MIALNPSEIINSQQDNVKDFQASVTDINARSADGNTLLMQAVSGNSWKIAKFLLEAKANVSANDSINWTALHYAANFGRVELIKPLIEARCGINIQSKSGNTALMLAACYPEIVCMLLEAKANTTLENDDDDTALDLTIDGSESQNLLLLAGLPAPPEAPPAPLPANLLSFIA